MYQLDFNQPIHVFFIGIGGISMSGLSEILLRENFKISGSDRENNHFTESLTSLGANIYIGHRSENISDDVDLVVYTAAIKKDNPEYLEAATRQIPILTRAQLLGQLMKNYKTPIAISGTHGKTTTTSMISSILLEANTDPTLSIGGVFSKINGNIRVGNSEYFVTEACEYTNSFLEFHPKIAIILNVEEDHMDFFNSIDEILESFHKFAALVPSDGYLIINNDIIGYEKIIEGLTCNIITYGFSPSSDYSFINAAYNTNAKGSFDIIHNGIKEDHISIGATGEHNILNSLASLALADILELNRNDAYEGLKNFDGTKRRFEYKGSLKGITIIDDYAHHPTEIICTLKAARNHPSNSIYCVFQPHTYTRTDAFLKDFAKALSLADHIILADIYAAREKNTIGITSQTLQKEIKKLGHECYYFPNFDEIENFLLENCVNGDLLITMGAGDIGKVGESLLGI